MKDYTSKIEVFTSEEGFIDWYGFMESMNVPEWMLFLNDVGNANPQLVKRVPFRTDALPVEFFAVFMGHLSPVFRPNVTRAMESVLNRCLPNLKKGEMTDYAERLVRLSKILNWGIGRRLLKKLVRISQIPEVVRQQAAIVLAIGPQNPGNKFWLNEIDVKKDPLLAYPRMLALESAHPRQALRTLALLPEPPEDLKQYFSPAFYALKNLIFTHGRQVPVTDLLPPMPEWAQQFVLTEVLAAKEFREAIRKSIPEGIPAGRVIPVDFSRDDHLESIAASGENLRNFIDSLSS